MSGNNSSSSRFSKGTLDHDGDGRMGGSRKENDMTRKTDNPLTDEQIKASLEANDPSHSINAATTDKYGVKDDDTLLEKHIVTEDGIKPASEVEGTDEYKDAHSRTKAKTPAKGGDQKSAVNDSKKA